MSDGNVIRGRWPERPDASYHPAMSRHAATPQRMPAWQGFAIRAGIIVVTLALCALVTAAGAPVLTVPLLIGGIAAGLWQWRWEHRTAPIPEGHEQRTTG